jgi:hypothetical protein
MIIVDIRGGLGNQMFQYAFGRSLAIHKDVELKLDITNFETYELSEFLLDRLNVTYLVATKSETDKYKIKQYFAKYLRFLIKKTRVFKSLKFRKMYFEKQGFTFDPGILSSSSVYYVGYWQSYKYFNNIREVLIKEFTLKENFNEKNLYMLSQIEQTNAVSLHVRRGDYVSNEHTNTIHGTCSLDYYNKAAETIAQRIESPIFYIFSDDINWVRDNLKLKFPMKYIDFNNDSPENDIILMSNCKHNIIANSSFSWWGGWLNEHSNKIVCAPKKWINTEDNTNDLIPKDWIRI